MAALLSREPATRESRAACTRAISDRRSALSIALVTGSSTGIGLATAVTLARVGHKVYATMRNPEKGGVEITGIAQAGAVEDMPLSEFRQVMETNFFGALRCIQAVLPAMRERRSGCIVNVTSVAGRIAVGAQAAYSGSKWALEALSESLAAEVRA